MRTCVSSSERVADAITESLPEASKHPVDDEFMTLSRLTGIPQMSGADLRRFASAAFSGITLPSTDQDPWCREVPLTDRQRVGSVRFYLAEATTDLRPQPRQTAGAGVGPRARSVRRSTGIGPDSAGNGEKQILNGQAVPFPTAG